MGSGLCEEEIPGIPAAHRHDTIREIYGDTIKSQDERIERVLFMHIFSLALTQFDLILHNHFIRGGMTIGGLRRTPATSVMHW